MSPQDERNLERFVDQAIRGLPTRRAPSALEARVQAEIARRAALPWWHKSFAHWPLAARGGFLVVCAGVVKLLLMAVIWATAGFDPVQFKATFATELNWAQTIVSLLNMAGEFVRVVIGNIPPLWLYGGAAIIAALYLTLFGLGAAAYRMLYASR